MFICFLIIAGLVHLRPYHNSSGQFTLPSDVALGNSAMRMTTLLIYLHDQPTPSVGELSWAVAAGVRKRREGGREQLHAAGSVVYMSTCCHAACACA